MKVLFVAPVDPSGTSGHNIATSEVISALLDHSENLDVSLIIAQPASEYLESIAGRVSEVEFLPRKKPRSFLWHARVQFSMVRAFHRLVHRERPDIVVTRLEQCVTLPLMTRAYRIPLYVLIRGLGGRDTKMLTGIPGLSVVWKLGAFLHCRAAQQVYVAYREILDAVAKYRRPEQLPPVIFPNAVDPRQFPGIALRQARESLGLPLTMNDFVIGFAGSIKARHCLDTLLDVLRNDTERSLKLLVAGEGPERKRLQARAEVEGLSDRVFFVGFVAHSEIHRYMSAANALYGVVDPGEVENPIKCYEYLAAGRPVITSEKEELLFIREHDFGAVVNEVNPSEISRTISWMREAGETVLSRMGATGRRYVLEHHTWDRLVERIMQDYRQDTPPP